MVVQAKVQQPCGGHGGGTWRCVMIPTMSRVVAHDGFGDTCVAVRLVTLGVSSEWESHVQGKNRFTFLCYIYFRNYLLFNVCFYF